MYTIAQVSQMPIGEIIRYVRLHYPPYVHFYATAAQLRYLAVHFLACEGLLDPRDVQILNEPYFGQIYVASGGDPTAASERLLVDFIPGLSYLTYLFWCKMSQSDPTQNPKYINVELCLRFRQGDTFEVVAGQLQKECKEILCVVDGVELRYYHDCESLPDSLIFEHKQVHKKQGIVDYYYRCTRTDSLYAFFLTSVHDYLKTQEETNCINKIVRVQPRTNAQIKAVLVTPK